jgi:hypothetical protein
VLSEAESESLGFLSTLEGENFLMSNEFINSLTGDYRPVQTSRRSVKILLIGQPEDVEVTIARLYHCGFCRVEDWSRALPYAQIQQATAREPGEILRIYKRSMTL